MSNKPDGGLENNLLFPSFPRSGNFLDDSLPPRVGGGGTIVQLRCLFPLSWHILCMLYNQDVSKILHVGLMLPIWLQVYLFLGVRCIMRPFLFVVP